MAETEPLCMDIAPPWIAVCEPRGADGLLRTPWCHLERGHRRSHRCGEHVWANEAQPGGKRPDRPLRVAAWWEGGTRESGGRFVEWHMRIYSRGQKYCVAVRLDERHLYELTEPCMRINALVGIEQRIRDRTATLRRLWRNAVLGVDWQRRKAEARRARMTALAGATISCSFCGGEHQLMPGPPGARTRMVSFVCNGRMLSTPEHRPQHQLGHLSVIR